VRNFLDFCGRAGSNWRGNRNGSGLAPATVPDRNPAGVSSTAVATYRVQHPAPPRQPATALSTRTA
jgi:hypothetical protein